MSRVLCLSNILRLLLSRAAAAPATFGRQLFQQCMQLSVSTALRGRAVLLAKLALDTLDDIATCEFALQAYTLSVIGNVCHSLLEQASPATTKAALSDALRSALSAITLPHTVRVPITAAPLFVPSILASRKGATADTATIVEACLQTAYAGIGVLSFPSTDDATSPVTAQTSVNSTALPAAGIPISGIVAEKCAVTEVNVRRQLLRCKLVCRVGREADAVRVLTATAQSTLHADDVEDDSTVAKALRYVSEMYTVPVDVHAPPVAPRAFSYYNSCVAFQLTIAEQSLLFIEQHHAHMLNSLALCWREDGQPIGDVVPPYVVTLHSGRSANTVTSHLYDGHNSDSTHAVSQSVYSMLMTHEQAVALSDVIAVESFGKQSLPRWFMSAMLATDAMASSPSAGMPPEGAYEEVVHRYLLCLAGVVVSAYVLALGPRRLGDITVTPQGFVALSNIQFTDGTPDRVLHSTKSGECVFGV